MERTVEEQKVRRLCWTGAAGAMRIEEKDAEVPAHDDDARWVHGIRENFCDACLLLVTMSVVFEKSLKFQNCGIETSYVGSRMGTR